MRTTSECKACGVWLCLLDGKDGAGWHLVVFNPLPWGGISFTCACAHSSLLFVTSEHLFVANGFYPQDARVTWGNIILVLQRGASGPEEPRAAQKAVMGPCTGHSQVET